MSKLPVLLVATLGLSASPVRADVTYAGTLDSWEWLVDSSSVIVTGRVKKRDTRDGVRLVAACAHYDPRGVLIWIPDERMFGTWDCDHHIIHVLFAARGTRGGIVEPATWSNIQANPIRYLPPYPGDATSCKLLIPWPKYRWQEN